MRVGACGGGRGKGREEGEVEKDGGCYVLAVAREQKCAAAKSVAAACFPITCYC